MRDTVNDLVAFLTVARERSFTKAAAQREVRVRAEGQMVCNTVPMMLDFALAGVGLAHLPEDVVQQQVHDGRLIRVLEDWCPVVTGYHLYYPSRRQPKPAFKLLLELLRANV